MHKLRYKTNNQETKHFINTNNSLFSILISVFILKTKIIYGKKL